MSLQNPLLLPAGTSRLDEVHLSPRVPELSETLDIDQIFRVLGSFAASAVAAVKRCQEQARCYRRGRVVVSGAS
jgi:hypothetical protein